jgi:ribonuclease HII
MVLAAVALAPNSSRRLSRAGVADSKTFGTGELAHARRLELAHHIREHATHIGLEVCDVATIDDYVGRGALNILERERAERLIAQAPVSRRIVADGERLFGSLRSRFPQLEARDRGESHHVAVAAASIMAKVERDRLFLEIAARYADDFGPIRGLGYVNAGTRRFGIAYHARHGRLPPEARTSWPWAGVPRATPLPEPTSQLGLDFADFAPGSG